MQRRSFLLTMLVCYFLGFGLTNAAFSQFGDANWKRWDWELLNPGDEPSATEFRLVSSSKSNVDCSTDDIAEQTGGAVEYCFALQLISGPGKCRVSSVAACFSRGTRWFHGQLVGIFGEFKTIWEGWLWELKSHGELVCCAREALLAMESRQRSDAYWSYYEDRARWLPSKSSSPGQANSDWLNEGQAKAIWENQSTQYLLSSLSTIPARFPHEVCGKVGPAIEWTALGLLELSDELVREAHLNTKMKAIGNSKIQAVLGAKAKAGCPPEGAICKLSRNLLSEVGAVTLLGMKQAVFGTKSVIDKTIKSSVVLLTWVPIEAIGYVLPD